MSIRVHVGGQILPPEAAHVSVFDRGFLFGDSVYETIATTDGRLFALCEHLDRLEKSAFLLGIVPPARVHIEAAVRETVAAAGNAESRVRVMISRGVGGWGDLDPASAGEPNLVVIVGPRGGPAAQMYGDGVGVVILPPRARALDPAVKSGNYLPNLLAVGAARRQAGAHEAILCAADGGVAEGASSNLFVVAAGVVATPALSVGLLDGVTRRHVIALCRQEGLPIDERTHLSAEQVRRADEVFLTSSVRGILPVTAVDSQPIADGRPGPVTRALMRAYAALTSEGRP